MTIKLEAFLRVMLPKAAQRAELLVEIERCIAGGYHALLQGFGPL